MLFLPIGHDQTIRRFPWLTVAIMAICTLLQLQRLAFAPSWKELADAESLYEQQGYSLVDRMKPAAPTAAGPADPDGPDGPDGEADAPPTQAHGAPIVLPKELAHADAHQLLSAVRAGKLGDPRDPGVVAYRAAESTLHALQQRDLVMRWGYRPSSGLSPNLLLSAFVHGGFIHLAGNLLFLWLCGCNLEDRWGRPTFFGVYAISAILSSLAYGLVHKGSDVPLVGASGAIAGAMGAFLICYHSAQIKYWWWWNFRTGTMFLPAYVAFPVWFLSQLGQSLLEVSGFGEVAYSAHVGGFAFGVLAASVIRFGGLERFLRPTDDDDGLVLEPAASALATAIVSPPMEPPGPVAAVARGYSKRPPVRPYVAPTLHRSDSNYSEDPAILRPRLSSQSSQPAPFGPMSHAPEIPAAPRLPDFGAATPDVASWPPSDLAATPDVASWPPPELAAVPDVAPWPPPAFAQAAASSPLEELRRTLEAEPQRDDLRYELCRLAIELRDPEQIDLTATRTFLWLAEQERWKDVIALYDAFVATGIDRPLSDRAFSVIVRAAVETNNPKLCVSSAQKMANVHPQSPLLPRALWDVGNAQERGGRPEFARKTFTMLVSRFPQHRFADEARKRLG